MSTWDSDGASALDEFAEEGDAPRREADAPRRAWNRPSFPGRASTVAPEKAREDTPIVWVIPTDDGVSWWRWIGAAAGLAACAAIVVAIVIRSSVPPPAQSSNSLPARTVPFVPIALPHVLSQVTPDLSRVTPAVPLSTPDRGVPPSRPSVPVATASASVPATVTEEIRPAETPAAIPTAPASSAPPVARSTVSEPPAASARTEGSARTPEPAAAASTREERDKREIRDVLDAYRDSYERRDVASSARLWPGVNKAALSRAFGTLARQEIDFAECSLDVAGQRAKARCIGSLQYVRRVGNGSPQTRSLLWEVELDRSSGHWLIDRMTAQ